MIIVNINTDILFSRLSIWGEVGGGRGEGWGCWGYFYVFSELLFFDIISVVMESTTVFSIPCALFASLFSSIEFEFSVFEFNLSCM